MQHVKNQQPEDFEEGVDLREEAEGHFGYFAFECAPNGELTRGHPQEDDAAVHQEQGYTLHCTQESKSW